MEPRPITVIGSCVGNQLINRMPDYKMNWVQNMTSDDCDERYREKLSVASIPAGKIADRLYEDMKAVVYKRRNHYT